MNSNVKARRLRHVPRVAAVLLAAAGAVGATACGPQPDAEYGGVCVDEKTGKRVDDDRCGDYDDHGHTSTPGMFFMWMPMNSGHPVPAVGERANLDHGKRTVPAGTPIARGVPTQGGTSMASIHRGGFGAKAGTTGGIGGMKAGA